MELTTEEKKKITKEFGFKDYEPRVLIFGGSQGAQSINDSMIEIITEKAIEDIKLYGQQAHRSMT